MYNEFFGFRESPFNLTPDPRVFYSNSIYQRAYANLLYGICDRKGVTVLTGEVGTGKTTLLRRLMSNLGNTFNFAFCPYTLQTFAELLDFVCYDLGMPENPDKGPRQLDVLYQFLLAQQQQGKSSALLLDEAHNLSPAVLDSLCLFLDLSVAGESLLPVVLVGQPGLTETLATPSLDRFRQHITLACQLDRLKPSEIGPFIFYRLREAGSQNQELFPPQVIQRIEEYSEGIPRHINIICDNALLITYTEAKRVVTEEIIDEVATDLQLTIFLPDQQSEQAIAHEESSLEEIVPQEDLPPIVPPFLRIDTENHPTHRRHGRFSVSSTGRFLQSRTAAILADTKNLQQSARRFFTRQYPQFVTWAGLGFVGVLLLLLFSQFPGPEAGPIGSSPPLKREATNAAVPSTTTTTTTPSPQQLASSPQHNLSVSTQAGSPILSSPISPGQEESEKQSVAQAPGETPLTDTQSVPSAAKTTEEKKLQIALATPLPHTPQHDRFQRKVTSEGLTVQPTDSHQTAGKESKAQESSSHNEQNKPQGMSRNAAEQFGIPIRGSTPQLAETTASAQQNTRPKSHVAIPQQTPPAREKTVDPFSGRDKKQQAKEIASLPVKDPVATRAERITKRRLHERRAAVSKEGKELLDSEAELLKQAAAGNLQGVKALLRAQTSPNTTDKKGWTPLMMAVMNGHTNVVHALLRSGADVNKKNSTGRTALMIAALAGHDAILQALLDNNADANTTNAEGWSALMYAAWNGHTKIVQTLLRKGTDVNVKNIEGWTPLMYAVHNGHVDTTRALLAGQAGPTVKNYAGESALTFAARRGDVRLKALLRAAKNKE
ncbi:MAG: ankyrin repeat domain-containing protein [Candidatus Binatia bacterium]